MLNQKLKLSDQIFNKEIEKKACRDGYGEGLILAGQMNEQVVALSADLARSTRVQGFAEKFPERFFQVGVAEQLLVTVASGLASGGKIPFASSFAIFSPGRNWEQIRTTIALNDLPVKLIGSHAGLTVGQDGANHQMLEDLALMRTIPGMVVLAPVDAIETTKAVLAAVGNNRPTYIRFPRSETPVLTTPETPFEIGQAEFFWEDQDPQVAIFGCGPLIYEALKAARDLAESKINSLVLNCQTIKPLDEMAIIRAAKLTGAVVTIEEHQLKGGLGSAVAEVLSQNFPAPIEMIGMDDRFGESGQPQELLTKYNLDKEEILKRVRKVIKRKQTQE